MNKIQIDKLVENHGQIHGLPSNPRTISDEKFQKLKQSLIDDPEMLESRPLLVYPYGGENVVIGGNMRLQAAKALNMESIPCYIFPEETPIEKIRAIVIKDNLGYGDWDWSLISADWDLDELSSWGMDLPKEWDNIEKKHQDISDDLIEKFCIEVSCVNEQEQESLFNELTQKGYECRILTL